MLVVSAMGADIDFGLSYVLGRNVHHHFTHGVGFVALYFTGVWLVARRTRHASQAAGLALWSSLSYLTHLGLDLLSKDPSPPSGLQFWWPLSDDFYISPVLVFDEVWRGSLARLFGLHNWMAVGREVLILGPVAGAAWWWRSRRPQLA
jgi:membrane-bound metal-dependent hydrolase YbcI (DUF457 family)